MLLLAALFRVTVLTLQVKLRHDSKIEQKNIFCKKLSNYLHYLLYIQGCTWQKTPLLSQYFLFPCVKVNTIWYMFTRKRERLIGLSHNLWESSLGPFPTVCSSLWALERRTPPRFCRHDRRQVDGWKRREAS